MGAERIEDGKETAQKLETPKNDSVTIENDSVTELNDSVTVTELDKELVDQVPVWKKDADIPTVDIEDFEIPETAVEEVEDKSGGALKMGIIGSGQCGGRLAEAFQRLGYTKAISVNTTEQDVTKLENSVLFPIENMPGGAGKDMAKASEAFEAEKDKLYNLMARVFGDVDHILVCAGAGGGTGGGTIAGILDLAKRYMRYTGKDDPEKRVGGIITLPSVGEAASPTVASNAATVGRQLSKLADEKAISPLIVIDNDKILSLYPNLTMKAFYPTINNTVAQLFHVFNRISKQSSEYITFDATDFISVVQSGGHLIMGVTTVPDYGSDTAISNALKTNLAKTLLASHFDLTTTTVAAVIVVAGQKIMDEQAGLVDNIEFGFATVANMTGNAMVHRGIYVDPVKESLRVYTMLSGLAAPVKRYDRLKVEEVSEEE